MFRHVSRLAIALLTLWLMGCGSADSTEQNISEESDAGAANPAACQLLEDLGDCGACFTGMATCTYGDISVTESSCQQCQAQAALYAQLCNSGSLATAEELEEGIECTESDS